MNLKNLNDEMKAVDQGNVEAVCPKCYSPMVKRKSSFNRGHWFSCSNYPKCDITFSLDANGKIMSYPADKELRGLRRQAHDLMEKIWGVWGNQESRKGMYGWLEENTASKHIGHMGKDEVVQTIDKLKAVVDRRECSKLQPDF